MHIFGTTCFALTQQQALPKTYMTLMVLAGHNTVHGITLSAGHATLSSMSAQAAHLLLRGEECRPCRAE